MFEFLFKYPLAVFSKGTLVLLGSWPLWILFVAMLFAAAVLGWLIWRRQGSAAATVRGSHSVVIWILQSALVALLLLLLWQPALSVTSLQPQQNIVAILVADSKSMALPDRRDDLLRVLNGPLIKDLQIKLQVLLYRFLPA